MLLSHSQKRPKVVCFTCIKPPACSVILESYVERQSDTLEFNTINWCQALAVIWINGAGSNFHTHTHTHTRGAHLANTLVHTIASLDAD